MTHYKPDELYEKFRSAKGAISRPAFFNSPSSGKIQEMWCAARFGQLFQRLYGDCLIHIADDDLQEIHDFLIEYQKALEPIQITECIEPGRRRGDEYREGRSPDPAVANERWENGTEHGVSWVRDSIEKKTRKYAGSSRNVGLLVYLNFRSFNFRYEEMLRAAEPYLQSWNSVWLISREGLACLKPFHGVEAYAGWYIDEAIEG